MMIDFLLNRKKISLTSAVFLFILSLNSPLHAQNGAGFFFGYETGNYTYGLRNIQCYLEDFNFSNQYEGRLIKPFTYSNGYKGFNFGIMWINEIEESLQGWVDAGWTHHRNIYEAQAFDFDYKTMTYSKETTFQYRERINYLSLGAGLMGFRFIYGGIGLDFGKLSFHERNFPTEEKPPKFTREWHGDIFISPGGNFTSLNLFLGVFPHLRSVGLNAKLFYQLQLLPSGAMVGSSTSYYINTSCWGIKLNFCIGNFTDLN